MALLRGQILVSASALHSGRPPRGGSAMDPWRGGGGGVNGAAGWGASMLREGGGCASAPRSRPRVCLVGERARGRNTAPRGCLCPKGRAFNGVCVSEGGWPGRGSRTRPRALSGRRRHSRDPSQAAGPPSCPPSGRLPAARWRFGLWGGRACVVPKGRRLLGPCQLLGLLVWSQRRRWLSTGSRRHRAPSLRHAHPPPPPPHPAAAAAAAVAAAAPGPTRSDQIRPRQAAVPQRQRMSWTPSQRATSSMLAPPASTTGTDSW